MITWSDPNLLSFAAVIAQAPAGQTAPPPQFTTTATLPAATVGVPYSVPIAVTSGAPPYTWSATGTLPPGLSLDGTTGVISGTPQRDGTYQIPVTVADSLGGDPGHTISQTFTLVVSGPTITTASLPFSEYGLAYHATLQATGGVGTLTWSVPASGQPHALPTGITLSSNGSQATLTGSPSYDGYSQYRPTFTVTDQDGNSSSVTLTIQDEGSPAIYDQGFGNTILPNKTTTTATTKVPTTGEVGVPFQAQWVANAKAGYYPFTWSIVSGGLPTGVHAVHCTDAPDCFVGQATGTPTRAGTYTFTAEITDQLGGTGTQTDTVTIGPAPRITTASLPDTLAGTPYRTTLALTGGTGPYTWGASSNGFQHVSVSGTGATATLSFTTTTTPGTYPVTLTVTDALGATDHVTLTLHVAQRPPLVVTPPSLPGADRGVAYDVTFGASGGSGGPYTFAESGALPAGVSFDCSPSPNSCTTATLKGTPTSTGKTTFTVTATDFAHHTHTQAYTLTVAPPPAISTTSLPDATFGTPYTQTLQVVHGTGTAPYTWALTTGALPDGLSLDPTTGVVSGTLAPDAADAAFTVSVTDAAGDTATSQTLAIDVPLTVETPTTLPATDAGVPYDTTVVVGGGVPPYSWSVSSGSTLPTWMNPLVCSDPSCGNLVLGGSPTLTDVTPAGSPDTFSLTVTDSSTPTPATVVKTFSVVVAPPPSVAQPYTLRESEVGVYYAQRLVVTGGTGPFTWTADSPLPAGLSLGADGTVAGTPATAGTVTFTVSVTDHGTTPATTYGPFTLTLVTVPHVTVTGDGTTSAINFCGPDSFAGSVWVCEPAFQPTAEVGVPYADRVTTAGGVGPYRWSLFLPGTYGRVPPGLQLSATGQQPATGLLSGTPTSAAAGPDGTGYDFGIEVTDALGASTEIGAFSEGTMIVWPGPPTIVTTTVPSVEVGAPYSAEVVRCGGAPGGTWTLTSGQLPPGITLTPNGGYVTPTRGGCLGLEHTPAALIGTPTQVGSYTFTLKLTDEAGGTASQTLTLDVTEGTLAITTTSLPTGVGREAYQTTLHAQGGTPPYTWSATGLPPGLTIDPLTGEISGTLPPEQYGAPPKTYTVQVTVADAAGHTATKSFTLTVYSTG